MEERWWLTNKHVVKPDKSLAVKLKTVVFVNGS